MRNINSPSAGETKVISINQKQIKSLRETYAKSTELELLTILGEKHMINPEQEQNPDSVNFTTDEIVKAKQELIAKGENDDGVKVMHNHNEDHGFGFSDQDLETAEMLYETQGINEMGLVKNGKTLEDGEIAAQHVIIANHEGELHDLEGTEGKGKVLTMFTDEQGEEQHIYSETIAEAEAIEQEIIMLKEILMHNDEELIQAA